MTVYAIALLNIADRERYGASRRGFMEIFSKYSGKLLAVDEGRRSSKKGLALALQPNRPD